MSESLGKFWRSPLEIKEEIRKIVKYLTEFWILNLTDEIERNFCKNVYNNFMSYERILKKLFAI